MATDRKIRKIVTHMPFGDKANTHTVVHFTNGTFVCSCGERSNTLWEDIPTLRKKEK